jgi:hypothetical protein
VTHRGVLQGISQAQKQRDQRCWCPKWEVDFIWLCHVLVPLFLHKILCGHCLWQWDKTAQLLVDEFNVLIYAFREIFLYALCNL